MKLIFLPDRCVLHIWVPGSDNADECSQLGVLLHLHNGALCRTKNGRLVCIRHAYPHDGLVPEGAQSGLKAGVRMLVDRLHYYVVCAFALEVQGLNVGRRI